MGHSCVKIPFNKTNPLTLSSKQDIFQIHRNPSFSSLTQIHLKIYNKKKVDLEGSQYFYIENIPLAHLKININSQNFKFNKAQHFEKMAFGQNFLQNEVGFVTHKTQKKNILIEVKSRQQSKLWRKISFQGVELSQENQVLFGNTTIKLLYWLDYQQCRQEKQRSNLKLPKSQIQQLECRVCLEQGYTGNPLLKPCSCSGSVSTIHQRCLSKWIFNNPTSFQENMSVFKVLIKKRFCEICKGSFNQYIWNRILNIISSFEGTYAIFEVKQESNKMKENIEEQEILILKFTDRQRSIKLDNFENQNYFLGQFGRETIDAVFYAWEKRLYIKDIRSNYGPYILMNNGYLNFGQEYKLGINYFEIDKKNFRRNSN